MGKVVTINGMERGDDPKAAAEAKKLGARLRELAAEADEIKDRLDRLAMTKKIGLFTYSEAMGISKQGGAQRKRQIASGGKKKEG